MNNIFIAAGIVGILCFHTVFSRVCTNNDEFGEQGPDSKDEIDPPVTGQLYLICGYQFPCCGVIESWRYESDKAGSVDLHVWRGSPDTYQIASTLSHSAAKGADGNIRLSGNCFGDNSAYTIFPSAPVTDDRYTVNSPRNLVLDTDCPGWFSQENIIGFKDGGDRAAGLHQTLAGATGEVDWSGAASLNVEWAIGGKLNRPASPTFSGPSTATQPETASLNDAVLTVTASDIDISDKLTLTMTGSTYFSLIDNGDGTGLIQVASSLGPVAGGTETVTITATDLCGLTVTKTVTIDITNEPPTFDTFSAIYTTSEDVPTEIIVATYTCSDRSGTVTSSFTVDPATPSFFLKKETGVSNSTSKEYAIVVPAQTDPAQRFNYNTQLSYDFDIKCCDSVECVPGDIILYLQQNTPPVITNIFDNSTADVNASAVIGHKIFTVDFHDVDLDTVDLSSICDPSWGLTTCPVSVQDSGDVIITGPIPDDVAGFDLFIYVADARNNGTSKTLSVRIIGRNNVPKFLNMNNSVTITDGTAAGVNIFTVSSKDLDGDNVFYQWTEASGGQSYFTLNSTDGTITTSQEIDYDTITPKVFEFIVSASDTEGDTATATLTVSLQDTNEPFEFSSTVYRGKITEWEPVTAPLDVVFTIIDGDATDTYTCVMDCGSSYSGYFVMSTSCNISVAALYKLDEGLPTEITCNVTATDNGGNVNKTSVVIAIDYDNNYTPTFDRTSYDFSVSSMAVANKHIGYVTATDGDAVSFNTFSYSLDTSGQVGLYFKIDAQTGEIKTRTSMIACDCAGTTFTTTVYATDTGGRVNSSEVLITVTETTTIVVTDRFKRFFDDERNIAWFSLLMVLLVITTAVTAFVCVKYVCMKPCKNPFGRRLGWRPRYFERPPSPKPPAKQRQTQLKIIRNHPPAGHSWQKQTGIY